MWILIAAGAVAFIVGFAVLVGKCVDRMGE